MLQEFREQVQVPGLEQEYLQQEGLGRSQGRRWEQEEAAGVGRFGVGAEYAGGSGSFSKGLKVGAGGGRNIRCSRDLGVDRSQKGRRWEQEEAAGVLQEFREQVQVPGLEQEYLQQEGLGRSQKGRRWELGWNRSIRRDWMLKGSKVGGSQEAEEGMPQEFREKKLLGYQEYYLLDSIHLPQQLYYL